ncbi:MAG: M28 family peptidase [Cytophagaceae bacterium]|nr:M28 family peptidase [Gemmatimonadaceae bacterium]
MIRRIPPTLLTFFLAACATASQSAPSSTGAAASTGELPALDAIRSEDIRKDISILASDAMRGREAGTIDELRASGWLVEQIRGIGLEPAGEDGTFYQWFNMRRIRLSDASQVQVAGSSLTMWKDVIVATPTDVTLNLPLVFVGTGSDAELQGKDLTGKAVAALLVAPPNPPGRNVSLASWRYATGAVRAQSMRILAKGAAAVVLVADSLGEQGMPFFAANAGRGSYGVDSIGIEKRPRRTPPVLLVRGAMLDRVKAVGSQLSVTLTTESFTYPTVNIVGRVNGTSASKRNEYVLYSAHQDHDGVRFPIDGDSIWNGADDNATVSVALMAIARAFVKRPGERPTLFVWHGAEERGLIGSRYHAAHPMVPRDQIIAVLNADMMGRNSPDSASLLGVQPPHRNSADLVQMALRANDLTGKFKLDSIWDRPTHPEGWYFRSDHLPYARLNIPAVEYSSNLHPDYHTPRDEWERIDISKLTRMTQWMYATGWLVSNAAQRPRLDPGFKLER